MFMYDLCAHWKSSTGETWLPYLPLVYVLSIRIKVKHIRHC